MMALKIAISCFIIFASSRYGCVLVVKLLEIAKLNISDSEDKNVSKWIGYLERAIVTLFVFLGLISETVFIFAIKAAFIAYRIPKDTSEGDKKKLSEYMLVGTMASYFIALIFGLAGTKIINMLGQ